MSGQHFPGSWGCNFVGSVTVIISKNNKQINVYRFVGL